MAWIKELESQDDPEVKAMHEAWHAKRGFVRVFSLKPALMRAFDRDLDSLRRHGFSDTQILEITTLAGFFNFITRVADALGVESNAERKALEALLFHGD